MKTLLITALCLILVGSAIFLLVVCFTDGGFKEIFNGNGTETVKNVTDSFDSININTDTANITLLPSDDESCKVVSYDVKKIKYEVSVVDGALRIKATDERRWFERIFSFCNATLEIYLTENAYSSLSIDEDTGNISVPNDFSFKNVDIDLSTGNTELCASVSNSVSINGSTGDVRVNNIGCGSLSVEVSTGDVYLENVECRGDINIGVSTGDIELKNVSFANLRTEGDTGDIYAKALNSSGNLSIKRSTGKVTIEDATVIGDITTETDTGNTTLTSIDCKGDVRITVTTGKSVLSDTSCRNLITVGNSGRIEMTDVIASGKFDIERSTGNVIFTRCDALEITVLTDTGDVRGSLLSEKIFFYETDTGDVDLPETLGGGKCKITTDTGDIKITVGN